MDKINLLIKTVGQKTYGNKHWVNRTCLVSQGSSDQSKVGRYIFVVLIECVEFCRNEC